MTWTTASTGTTGWVARCAEIVEDLDTYTEVSPSGEGLHCILRGTVPAGARKQAVLDGQKVEVYSQGRFFCMTGASITNGTPIGDRQPQLEALCSGSRPRLALATTAARSCAKAKAATTS